MHIHLSILSEREREKDVDENQATVHSTQFLLIYICIHEALFAFDKDTNCKYLVFKSFKIKLYK